MRFIITFLIMWVRYDISISMTTSSCYQSISHLTQPIQPMNVGDVSCKDRSPHLELHALLFTNSEWVL